MSQLAIGFVIFLIATTNGILLEMHNTAEKKPTPSPFVACSPEKVAIEQGQSTILRAWVKWPTEEQFQYRWTPSKGIIVGQGRQVTWELKGVGSGVYRSRVAVEDRSGTRAVCSLEVLVYEEERGHTVRETGRSFLLKNQTEKEGYGLYSYILFGSRPTETNRERYLKIISAYLNAIEGVLILEDEHYERNQLNITYLPVDAAPPRVITVAWILDHYDFGRARSLLDMIPGERKTGIYISSCLTPLSNGQPSVYSLQDLSTIPTVPEDLISWWIREFINQAAEEHFWRPNRIRLLILKLRTTIAVAAAGLPEVQRSLQSWLTFVK